MRRISARTEADGGSLFRYAVALYATGEEAAAHAKFETAIRENSFLPTSELQNLKQYIPINVLGMAYDLMDKSYPAPQLDLRLPGSETELKSGSISIASCIWPRPARDRPSSPQ